MDDLVQARRRTILHATQTTIPAVRLEQAENAARASLRAGMNEVAALSDALGMALPTKPKTSARANGLDALWLGPDEWLLIGPEGTDFMALGAGSGVLHSMVEISHRNVAFLVSGRGAAQAINAGCPQDLSLAVFPVGACSRTVFGKIEIILYRTASDVFRVECWRSFSEYCFGMLSEGAKDVNL